MPNKILLDAGHGGVEPGIVYDKRQEKNDTLNLALAVGQILKDNGVDVAYTRTTDVYNSPFERATIANNSDADFVISIHRHSGNQPNTLSGVQTLLNENTGIKNSLGENINKFIVQTGYEDLGIEERSNMVLLNHIKKPVALVLPGVINNDLDNTLFDQNFYDIAKAITKGILKTYSEMNKEEPVHYRVQVGQYLSRVDSLRLLKRLEDEGFPVFMIFENNLYKIQVGACEKMEESIRMESKLRKCGYNTFITT